MVKKMTMIVLFMTVMMIKLVFLSTPVFSGVVGKITEMQLAKRWIQYIPLQEKIAAKKTIRN